MIRSVLKKTLFIINCLLITSCAIENDQVVLQEVPTSAEEVNSKSSIKVQLIKAWDNEPGNSGFLKRYTVKVANLGYEKKVAIHHKTLNGEWKDIPLQYSFQIDHTSEIWVGRVFTEEPVFADEFVVKYEVNGTTYWDNNDGSNYRTFTRPQGYQFGDKTLKVSVDTDVSKVYYHSAAKRSFSIMVDIRSKGHDSQKEVGVVYTTDGWATQGYLSLSQRDDSIPTDYDCLSPNYFGVERWNGSVLVDVSINTIEYAVVYKENRLEYWDNNYGKNYRTAKEF